MGYYSGKWAGHSSWKLDPELKTFILLIYEFNIKNNKFESKIKILNQMKIMNKQQVKIHNKTMLIR